MQSLPAEIKITYLIAFLFLFIFVGFIIFMVRLFNKRQVILLLKQENLKKDAINLQLQAQISQQEALSNERQRIAYDMHDDLGSGLSSIKIISQLLKKKHQDADTQNELTEIVNHASKLTTNMRELVWLLNPGNDTMYNFVVHCITYTKTFFDQVQLPCIVNTTNCPPEHIVLDSIKRRNLLLSIKEVYNNILKHANASQVDVLINYSENILSISIKDNGIGFSKKNQANTGLVSLQNRMQEINGSIQFINSNNGLEVILKL